MTLFHRRKPYEEILNNQVLLALKERSKYPVCRDYFGLKEIETRRVKGRDVSAEEIVSVIDELAEKGHRLGEETGKHSNVEIERVDDNIYLIKLSLKTPQKELESKGIDTLWWKPVYSKIVEQICSEGEAENLDDVIKAEVELEQAVHRRAFDKDILYNAQFDRDHIRKYALENGMDPDKVEKVFEFLAAKNQYIQDLDGSAKKPGSRTAGKAKAYNGGWQVKTK
ncbi:hypothetical protein KY343_05960 [Candidatus Woesearchaeota archaeon]|nr:hypothetical protein [Candidatus Woesearchaeota archaeon]